MIYFSQKTQGGRTFRCFNRKGWSLFGCLGREVRIGVLSVATLGCATPCSATLERPDGGMKAPDSAAEAAPPGGEADSIVLGEAAVTALRAPLASGEAARQTVTLSQADLQAAAVTCVADVLKLAAGVDVRQRGGFGLQTDISIDGGTFDQVTLMVNGTSVVNPQTGHNASDFPLNLADIERIEIVEGAASRAAGAQAFGGVVNVITRGGRGSKVSARVEGGSYGTLLAEARTAWQFGRSRTDGRAGNGAAAPLGFSTSLSASYRRSDGAVDNGDFAGTKLYWQGVLESREARVDVQAGFTANDFGANTFYSPAYPDQWEATRRLLLSARAETKGRVRLVPHLSWLRSTDHYQLVRNSAQGENFHSGDVLTAGVGAVTDWRWGRTVLGGELRDDEIFSTNLGRELPEEMQPAVGGQPGRRYTKRDARTNVSFHLEHDVQLGRVALSAGVLALRSSAVDRRVRFYPGLDASVRLGRRWRLYASVNRGLRLPSFTDLWYKSPTQAGNAGLRPEENTSVRLGADFAATGVRLGLKAHAARGENMIDWVMRSPDDIFHATAFSLDKLGAGATLSLRPQAWWGSGCPVTELTAAYAWLYQHRRRGEPYFKSNYALEYLRHKLTARLTHRLAPGLNASWTLRVQQREGAYAVYQGNKPTGELQPYGTHALLDAKLTWQPLALLGFSVDAQNLTSHRYYDLAGVRQPGFLLMAGVRLALK